MLGEYETGSNTLNEEMAQIQMTLDNAQEQRTLDYEQVAQAFHRVELFEAEMGERIAEARLPRDTDPVRT
jgi:hypothetical protein